MPCAIQSLETRLCAEGNNCQLLLSTSAGQDKILDLQRCVPDISAVLVISNLGTYAGGALNSGGLAFTALPYIGTADEPLLWRLVGHELGHAMLELHDEYTSDGGGTCSLREGRNIVTGRGIIAGDWAWDGECTTEPCGQACTYAAATLPSTCPAGELCSNSQPCCEGGSELTTEFIGLVEGACYNECGYYRAAENCMMKNLSMPFCPGCIESTVHLLKDRDISSCPGVDESPPPGVPVIPLGGL